MFDVIVVGSGGAGLCCALEAKGLRVLVVSESKPTDAGTCMAQGGLNAVLYDDESDLPSLHVEDTLKGGFGLSLRERVEDMCFGAKDDVFWLDSLGMPFSRKNGKIARRKFGAASCDRTTYSQDYTGLKLLHTLYDNCLKDGIEFLSDFLLLDLIVEESTCKGVILLDNKTGEIKAYSSKSVVLATGGYAGIYHNFSSNAKNTTADGIAIALKHGAKLCDMEFVQFHPTTLKSNSVLISESARGAGGFLVNEKGERFVDELMTRDEVSRAVFSQIQAGYEVFLDIRGLSKEFIDENLPQEKKLVFLHENIDPSSELIPIKPAAHYSMGGILVDDNLQTDIKGLFAVGECANVKVHGANRLGGNSLLEIVHFGRVAGKSVCEYVKDVSFEVDEEVYKRVVANKVKNLFDDKKTDTFFKLRDRLSRELFYKAGIFRDEDGLKELVKICDEIENEYKNLKIYDTNMKYNTWLISHIKFANSLMVAKALAKSALMRKESRGAHFRSDFQKSNERALHSIVDLKDGVFEVRFEE